MSDTASDTTEITSASVRLAAMNYLARREHAAEELRQKLLQRFSGEDALVEQVVAKLMAENLQSDERFTEAFVTMRKRQGKGPLRIAQELHQKGVATELVEAMLDPGDPFWWELARDVRDKRFGPATPVEARDKARQIRFLQYRGFTSAQVRDLV